MKRHRPWRTASARHARGIRLAAVVFSVLPLLAACGPGTATTGPEVPEAPGTIELNQGPDDVLMGGGGTGTVFFRGRLYRFAIGGLGIDGSAIAILQTSGRVYRLRDIALFAGTYRKAPDNTAGKGLTLRSESGSIMELDAPPQGQLPDIGTDAVRVVLE